MVKRVLIGLAVVGLLAWASGLAVAQSADGDGKKADKKATAKADKKPHKRTEAAEKKEHGDHKAAPDRHHARSHGDKGREHRAPDAKRRPSGPPHRGPGRPGDFARRHGDFQLPDFRQFSQRGGFHAEFRGKFQGYGQHGWQRYGHGGNWGPMGRRPGGRSMWGHGMHRGFGPGPGMHRGFGPGPGMHRGFGPGPGMHRGFGPGPGMHRGFGPGPGMHRGFGPGQFGPGAFGPGRSNLPKISPEEIFKKMDTNGDGSISKEEFMAAHKKMMELRKGMGQRPGSFGPRSGGPGMGPGGPGGPGMGPGMRPGMGPGGPGMHRGPGRFDPADMFKRADKNKDGKLTKGEVPDGVWQRLSKADANKDGAVTPDELKKAFQERMSRGEKPQPKKEKK